jgi:integrase
MSKYVEMRVGNKHVYGHTKAEALKKIAKLKADKENGLIGDNPTFGAIAAHWLGTRRNRLAPITVKNYGYYINRLSTLHSVKIKDLRHYHFQRVIDEIGEHPKTAREVRNVAGMIMDYAVKNDLVLRNVARKVDIPPRKHNERAILTEDQISEILLFPGNIVDKAFLWILLFTGVRRGECLALTWDDITSSSIQVNKSVSYGGVKAPKTPAGNRTIPIPRALNTLLADVPRLSPWLFPDHTGHVRQSNAGQYYWTHVSAQLGFKTSPHAFRHTYCSRLWAKGVDIKTASYLMGHSSVSITYDIYTHFDKSKLVVLPDLF